MATITHALADFLSGECPFLSEPNLSGFKAHHTLADFLSTNFDKFYLHAFKKNTESSKENYSTITDFLPIYCRGQPHTSR